MKTSHYLGMIYALGLLPTLCLSQAGPNEKGCQLTPYPTGWTVLDAEDPLSACDAEVARKRFPGYPIVVCEFKNYQDKQVTLSEKDITLPPTKVTEEVDGCTKGNQPTISKALVYSRSFTRGRADTIKFDLKIPLETIFGKIELQPGIGTSFIKTYTTTYGQTDTYQIPADPGYISWGQLVPRAVQTNVRLFFRYCFLEEDGRQPLTKDYQVENMPFIVPLKDPVTSWPAGSLSKNQRRYSSVAEFRSRCGDNELPDYLNPNAGPSPATPSSPPVSPSPATPSSPPVSPSPKSSSCPSPSGTGTKLQAVESALTVVCNGVNAGGIASNIAIDLRSRLNAMREEILNNKTGLEMDVASAKRFVVGAAETDISNEYKTQLDNALSAILTAAK